VRHRYRHSSVGADVGVAAFVLFAVFPAMWTVAGGYVGASVFGSVAANVCSQAAY
jgi:hypothetical protein